MAWFMGRSKRQRRQQQGGFVPPGYQRCRQGVLPCYAVTSVLALLLLTGCTTQTLGQGTVPAAGASSSPLPAVVPDADSTAAAAAAQEPAVAVQPEPAAASADGASPSSSFSSSVPAASEPAPQEGSDAGASLPATSVNSSAAMRPLSVAAGTVAQVAATGVPDRCIIAGSALFSSCAVEIATAQNRFNLTVDVIAPQNYTQLLAERGVTRTEVVQYLGEVLAHPSESCCNASCRFNQQLLCDCEPTVLQVAVRFAGADENFYGLMVQQLSVGCGHQYYINDTCPANITAALLENAARSGVDVATESSAASLELVDGTSGVCIPMNGSGAAEEGAAGQEDVADG